MSNAMYAGDPAANANRKFFGVIQAFYAIAGLPDAIKFIN